MLPTIRPGPTDPSSSSLLECKQSNPRLELTKNVKILSLHIHLGLLVIHRDYVELELVLLQQQTHLSWIYVSEIRSKREIEDPAVLGAFLNP